MIQLKAEAHLTGHDAIRMKRRHGHTISRGIFGSIHAILVLRFWILSKAPVNMVMFLVSYHVSQKNQWSGAGLGTHPVEEQRFYSGTTWI